eukprot:scaffold15698_cov154-Skeletonema_marinoi.AAC.13
MAMVSTKSSTSIYPRRLQKQNSSVRSDHQDILTHSNNNSTILSQTTSLPICFPTPVPNRLRLRLRPWNSLFLTRAFRAVPSTAIIPNTTFYRALPRRRSKLAFLLVPKK